jgi:hypothetical protein
VTQDVLNVQLIPEIVTNVQELEKTHQIATAQLNTTLIPTTNAKLVTILVKNVPDQLMPNVQFVILKTKEHWAQDLAHVMLDTSMMVPQPVNHVTILIVLPVMDLLKIVLNAKNPEKTPHTVHAPLVNTKTKTVIVLLAPSNVLNALELKTTVTVAQETDLMPQNVHAHWIIMKMDQMLIAHYVLEDVLNVLHAQNVLLVKKTEVFPLQTLVTVLMDIMKNVELQTELLVMLIAHNPIVYHVISLVQHAQEVLQLA